MIEEHKIGYLGWPRVWDIDELKEMGAKARKIGEESYTKSEILNKFLEII